MDDMGHKWADWLYEAEKRRVRKWRWYYILLVFASVALFFVVSRGMWDFARSGNAAWFSAGCGALGFYAVAIYINGKRIRRP